MALESPALAGLLASYLLGGALSLSAGTVMRPRSFCPGRQPWAVALHLAVWSQGYLLLLLVFRRPFFAAFGTLALLGVVVVVNNAKYRSLREPFVFQDFEYFTDAIKHPRLYLPFLGVLPLLGTITVGVAVVWSGLALEPILPVSYWLLLPVCEALIVCAWALANHAARRLPSVSGDIDADLPEFGLVGAAWLFRRQERRPLNVAAVSPFRGLPAGPRAKGRMLPDLVTIQSESFFDARRLYPQLRRDLLPVYDQLRATAQRSGRLRVPAWGANTIRTEFAFLTGIDACHLGVHRYQPYRYLAESGLPTIASVLRSRGYRTLCVHPYHGAFYRRTELMPLLGFDEFHDIRHFAGAARAGAYVSDVALAEYVRDCLATALAGPVYIHVITMENHGPLHLEKVDEPDRGLVLRAPLPAGCDDLVAYGRHLRNMDRMLDIVSRALENGLRPAGLCLFGDHVPIMPEVYRRLGTPPGPTDYLIWTPHHAQSEKIIVDSCASEISMDFLRMMKVI